MRRRRYTLKEVAQLAKVHPSTISRFLSGELAVKPETEAAIRSAIEKTEYEPDHIARSLRMGVTGTVAVVVPTVANPLFADIISGFATVLDESSLNYSIFPTMSLHEAEVKLCQSLVQKRYDAAVFMNPPRDADPLEYHILALQQQGMEIVFLNRAFGTFPVHEVFSDHQFGAYLATSRILAKGRRRVALMLGRSRSKHIDSIVKLRGYRQALHEVGLEVDQALIQEANFTFQESFRLLPDLLAERIDGLVCANDLMAAGALKAIIKQGLRVPDDIAIIGYGDTLICKMTQPELSSVQQDSVHMGQRAAEILLELLLGERTSEDRIQECLPVSLRERQSS